MQEQDIQYTTTPQSIALESRTHAFLAQCEDRYGKVLGMHVMRIESDQRNTAISRFINYLTFKDALPGLVDDIKDFLGDDEWVVYTACERVGIMYHLIAPSRHHDVKTMMRHQGIQESDQKPTYDGFAVYKAGTLRFVGRAPSLTIAQTNGQLRRRVGTQYYQGDELYSEDLW